MSKEYTSLPISTISCEDAIAEYVYLPKIVHMDDPAIDAMIDFQNQKPLSFTTGAKMVDARHAMESNDVHVALVFDKDHHLAGVVSLEQILSEKTVQMIEARRIERKDIKLQSVMTALPDVPVINIEKLKHAKIGHLVSTIKNLQRYYILVIETEGDKNIVRGIFLASTLSRLLGKRITINPSEAKSLAELQKKLHK